MLNAGYNQTEQKSYVASWCVIWSYVPYNLPVNRDVVDDQWAIYLKKKKTKQET